MAKKKKSGLDIELSLSDDMAEFMKRDTASRAEITQKLWKHIKKYGLQDAENRRMINPDDILEPILGSQQVSMFLLGRKISEHVQPL